MCAWEGGQVTQVSQIAGSSLDHIRRTLGVGLPDKDAEHPMTLESQANDK